MEKYEIWKNCLMGETLLLGLLGKILYQEPDYNNLTMLVSKEVFSKVPFGEHQDDIVRGMSILHKWTQKNKKGLQQEEFEAIQSDHLYLFQGVSRPLAPLWESVYFSEEKLLFQQETLQVRDWYARYGLQIDQKGQEPDDQLGLELSFLAHLSELALEALEQDESKKFIDTLQAQHEFLTEHLIHWVPVWVQLVQTHARTEFYQGLAFLTHGTLLAVTQMIDLKVMEGVV